MATTYKPTRVNLCKPIREACHRNGISTVALISALNAALGETKLTSEETTNGAGRVTKEMYRTSASVSLKYHGARTKPLEFDAWHSAIERANKIAEFDSVELPDMFKDWLSSFKKQDKSEKELVKA